MITIRKKWIFILLLLFSLVRCMPHATPKFNQFRRELMASHTQLKDCYLFYYNSPSFQVTLVLDYDKITDDEKMKIAKKVIRFVLSEEGYPEMIRYCNRDHKSSGFSDFYIDFTNAENPGTRVEELYSHEIYERRSQLPNRGFDKWYFTNSNFSNTIMVDFASIK